MPTYGEVRLKNLMLQMGVTGTEIAKKNNCSQSLVSMHIKGRRKSEKLDRYFEELKKEFDEMMGRFYLQLSTQEHLEHLNNERDLKK